MESPAATMAKASSAEATPPRGYLPEEIVVWEILLRLPPKFLLRCRAVCRAWHRAISTRDFLIAHHRRQPTLPIVRGEFDSDSNSEHGGAHYEDLLAFDHRAAGAQLQPVVRLGESYCLKASCDGILILSNRKQKFTICNPVTREHFPLGKPWDFSMFSLLGMYLHRPSGEHRLLLHWRTHGHGGRSLLCTDGNGCYVFTLGSEQPPRWIGGPDAASGMRVSTPVLVRDSLHWFPFQHRSEKMVLVFDTTTELFRHMHAPVVRPKSNIFEMDGTLGIYSYNVYTDVVFIWMLQNYDHGIWRYKYRVQLPVLEIRAQFGKTERDSYEIVVLADGGVLLLLSHGGWMFYVNTDGELVNSFHRDGQYIYASELRLKQTLVPHNFFMALEDRSQNASPFL